MKFWESGCTPSEENTNLGDIYGIPTKATSVENVFRVRRGVFSWSVINLSSFPDVGGLGVVFCHSPQFWLLETAWRLLLCPRANVNGQRGISLRLMRDANDSGPERVHASYRLGVGRSSNSVWFGAKETTFWKGNFFQLNTSVLGHLEDFFNDGVINGASVVCEIYVSYLPTSRSATSWEVSEIDESLPADMSALMASDFSKNARIEVRGGQMWAHKSVLCARSKTIDNRLKHANFRRPTDSDSAAVMLQLSCSVLCLKCVLSYMYTGSFDYLARNAYFSVGLYEIADELSLLPLRDLFYPDKKSSRSRIQIQSIEKVYSALFDVRSFFSNTTFRIQGDVNKLSDLQVSILVYKVGYLPNYCVAFKLEITGIGGAFHGETSLSLLNKHRGDVAARFLSQDLDASGSKLTACFVLTAAEFMSCDVASNSISVRVAFQIFQVRHDHVRRFVLAVPRKSLEPWCWREQLAQDLKVLLHCAYLSDASMVVEGRPFVVHRPLLAARSPYFHSLFYEGDDTRDVYLIDDLKPRTFWLMLNFIYCGTLSHFKDLTLEDFIELYRVSMTYGLSSLFAISSLFMKMMIGKLNFVDS